jgi:8-oxo-dGTP pyrophosphatase MutT (NUDIX family)
MTEPGVLDAGALAAMLGSRDRLTLVGERHAAVLVPIVQTADGPALLLTRRTDTLSTHQGQVAFPGGRVDPEDVDRVDTALREAEEEIALARANCTVLGLLDDVVARGKVVVTPVIAQVHGRPALTPNPAEVARIFTIPLAAMQIEEGWRTQTISWKGRTWPMYFFDYDGETLWGVSAYITLKLLNMVPGGAPFNPPDTDPRHL